MGENLAATIACDGSVHLTDWALLRAHGADAATFLQGQLTQDVVGLRTGDARLTGYCSAKGRLLASFIVWRMGTDEFGLLCSADLATAVRKRLSMYVLRARCRVDDASGEWSMFGLAGAAAQRLTDGAEPWRARQQGAQWSITLPAAEQTPRALLVQPAAASAPLLPALDPHAWSLLEVLSGVPRITAATAEQFVPQMVNLEKLGGVDFQKGCYPGQEIVARAQYRGQVKRRMVQMQGAARPGEEFGGGTVVDGARGELLVVAPV